MVNLKYIYILKAQGTYFTGSSYTPDKVLETFRKNDPTAEFQIVCALMAREATLAVKFLRYRMTDVDFQYWDKQSKLQQVRWIFRAANSEPALARDFSNEFNKR